MYGAETVVGRMIADHVRAAKVLADAAALDPYP